LLSACVLRRFNIRKAALHDAGSDWAKFSLGFSLVEASHCDVSTKNILQMCNVKNLVNGRPPQPPYIPINLSNFFFKLGNI